MRMRRNGSEALFARKEIVATHVLLLLSPAIGINKRGKERGEKCLDSLGACVNVSLLDASECIYKLSQCVNVILMGVILIR